MRLAPAKPPQSEHVPDNVNEKTSGSLSSWVESAVTPTAREETRKTERERGKDREATGFTHSAPCFNEHFYYIYIVLSLLVMNSEAAQEYNSFSLLANLEKNKVICQALFTLVRHSSPLPTWALSLSLLRSWKPPPRHLNQWGFKSPPGASFSMMFFIFKIYVCVFIYLTEILIQREIRF